MVFDIMSSVIIQDSAPLVNRKRKQEGIFPRKERQAPPDPPGREEKFFPQIHG